ncbi:hypothetical protein BG015_002495 [Linnemannia schmuckeri]|uniref:Uncharacterized protein n=1 Tax=Linnemannia schmuckeri TaxID=64567 RepID=A0A9P5SAR8_9FUNG|nr:hypothetical protein BG015_002495 [Linnemannia schmuckeri]
MLNSAVSDFSAKMSKHFHSNSVMPLSEANLSRHTLQSPASREAKLRHILVYVDLQRELIALAEEEEHNSGRLHPYHHQQQQQQQQQQQHRTVREKKSATLSLSKNELAHRSGEEEGFTTLVDGRSSRGLWHNNNSTHPKRSDLTILLHNSARHEQPHASSTPQQAHERQLQEQQQQQRQQQQQQELQHQQQQQNKHHQPTVSPSPIPLKHHDSAVESLRQQRQHHQQQQERNTRQTDALDPSLALPRALPRNRIPGYRDSYLSGDLDAEWQIIDDVGPDSPTIPNSHYPAFEFAPGHNESRHALPIQSSKSVERPIQYRRREESTEDCAIQRQPLQRQTSFEKEKKTGRFGRFSLPGRSKRASTTHQRKESLPEMSKSGGGGEGGAAEDGVHTRSFSISNKDKDGKDRVRFQDGRAAALDAVDSAMNPSASMVKRRSKVRQLLSEIFKKTPKQEQQQNQVISAPSPVQRAYPGSGHNILVSASITPQDLPPRAGTSLSHYARESMVDPLQRELYQIQTPLPTEEHLVLADNDNNNDDNNNNKNKDNNAGDNDADTPFLGQTSLTPPPAASVLRYSTSRPINLDQILSFHQDSAAAEDSSNEHKTRPSSNLMPIAGAIKDMATTAAASGSASGSGSGSDPYISQRRLVALMPEQPADLEGVGCRQNIFGMDCPNDLVVPHIATV